MIRMTPARILLLAALLAPAAVRSNPPWVQMAPYDPATETREQVLAKAASVVASPRQLEYQRLEYTCFIHFGINTFTGVEWGSGREKAALFNPGDTLDTDQWCRVAKEAGMRLVLITVKHHDGFCLWQTRYNDGFSVRAVPWRGGKGDVIRALSESCRAHGLKMGVYLSPADLYQMESKDGHYGNLSQPVPTVIPTDPASFRADPTRVRADKPAGAPVFKTTADDYNRYFMNQLYELLTEYGPIHEVWFDGAHPKRKGGQTYTKAEWFRLIRLLAPDAVIFGGPDVRWCGNESGATRAAEWSVLPMQDLENSGVDRPQKEVGTDDQLVRPEYEVYGTKYKARHLWFLISEVDTSIRAGWFWRDDRNQGVRTADDVFDIYERAVGGNTVFLLNVPPDRTGRFGERDVASLLEAGRRIRQTYGDASLMADATADAPALLDGKLETFWQPPGPGGEFILRFPAPRTVNRLVLQEAIGAVGQRVKEHALDAFVDGQWREIARAQTIGYKRILRFPAVTSDRLRVRILDARLAPAIATVSAHFYQAPPPAVAITRDASGRVTLSEPPQAGFGWKPHNQADTSLRAAPRIHFTTDGSAPTAASPRYSGPFDLADGGLVKAVAFVGDASGSVSEARLGILPAGWKIASVSSVHSPEYDAGKAIDGNPATHWHTDWSKSPAHPHTLVIDLGRPHHLAGFTYLPRQDKAVPDGMVESGEVSFSLDGITWTPGVPFQFGNLVNDPTQRTLLLDGPAVAARFFRFVSRTGAGGKPYAGAAEIGLLAAPR